MLKRKLFIIIQARMTSTRLPKKVMLALCGTSVLGMMLRRLERFRDNIIIATTDDGSEAPIVAFARQEGLRYHRGDTDDVLSRYYESGIKYGAEDEDIIVRLTSDCPLIDADIVQRCIETFTQKEVDYLSNISPRTYPRGLDCEVFSFGSLQKAFFRAKQPHEREHVTPFIHTTHKGEFTHASVVDNEDNAAYRLTLDEKADYEAIKEVYRLLDCRSDFSYQTLIEVLKANPHVKLINKDVAQKK
ncbi:MAG: cytidylyltransferase domain-containing protein [Campylobacterota bacterium]